MRYHDAREINAILSNAPDGDVATKCCARVIWSTERIYKKYI